MADAVRYRTGWLWAILTVLLVLGTSASALVVYAAVTLWPSGPRLGALAAGAIGALGALLSFLLLAGMLYRVDRLRGVPHRTVRLFE